jgi:hypothetical protein
MCLFPGKTENNWLISELIWKLLRIAGRQYLYKPPVSLWGSKFLTSVHVISWVIRHRDHWEKLVREFDIEKSLQSLPENPFLFFQIEKRESYCMVLISTVLWKKEKEKETFILKSPSFSNKWLHCVIKKRRSIQCRCQVECPKSKQYKYF